MKKYILFLLIFSLSIFTSGLSLAKQGCCSHHKGVAYCGSNGYYICNDGTRSPSCTCGGGTYYSNNYTNTYSNSYTNTYSNSYYPSYINTYTYQPVDKNSECKNLYGNNAYYSSYDQKCSCNYGYVLNSLNGVTRCLTYDENCQAMHGSQAYHIGNSSCGCRNGYTMVNWKCVSKDDDCKSKYGNNTYYNSTNNSCSCVAGYIFYNGECISENESCQRQYGTKSIAGDPGYCICMKGYVRDEKKTKCISEDTAYCGIYGVNSYLTTDNRCGCKDGFEWNSDMTKCIQKKENCNIYGPNSYMNDKGQCECSNNYEWNYNKNWCVADRNNKLYYGKDFRSAKDGGDYVNMLMDFEIEIHDKQNSSGQQEESNITYTIKRLTDDEKKFRTEKNKVMIDIPDDEDDLLWAMINISEEGAIEAKNRLGNEAEKIKAIVPAVLNSDEETQKKFIDTVLVLQNDKNQHTADIGNYLKFLLLYWDI